MEDYIFMKKVKIGIVGLGRLGKTHAENIAFRVPNCELKAVCSIVSEEVEQIQREWEIPFGYTDYYKMLENKDLDAIFIASSSSEHCSQIESALDAGFHVFSEKPLGVTKEECQIAEKAVEKHTDKVFMLGFMRRYDPSYAYAKKLIEQGEIGKPFLIKATSLDPEKNVQGAIKFAPTSGGIFIDMGAHDFDLARWLLGSPEPKSVYAIGGSFVHSEFADFGDVDNGCAILQFMDGTMAQIHVGRTAPHGYHIETEIIGTKGSLRIGNIPEKNQVTIFNNSGALRECFSGFPERFEQAYIAELQEFVNCIIHNKKPEISVYDGTKVTEIAFKTTQSFKENKLLFF
jgi:myo-inositol 2-dehydrogenase/D-chiro-inositol 1-dehydrogenase